MATFEFFDGNQSFYRYNRFNEFDQKEVNQNRIVLEYNGGNGPYDATTHPFRIELALKDPESYTIGSGSNKGETVFTEGSITRMKFFNQDGDEILRITDLDIDLAFYSQMALIGNLVDFFDFVNATDNTYNGAADASGPVNDNDGDEIRTGKGDDKVKAGGGDDFIKDFGGKDDYDGGKGPADTLSYDTWYADPVGAIQGIVADLGKGTVVGPDGYTDKIKNIESIRGTFLDDKITGDGNSNTFIGYQGDDDFNGKGGVDLLDYRNDEFQGGLDGIEVNVKKGTVRDGFGSTDTFSNIESFRGTGEKDIFKDHKGDQSYFGRNGNDKFELAKGNDYVEAGSGADKFIFKGKNFGNDTLNDYDEVDGDTLEISKMKKFNELTISQSGDDTLVEWKDSSILLRNVDAETITAEDFGLA